MLLDAFEVEKPQPQPPQDPGSAEPFKDAPPQSNPNVPPQPKPGTV